MGTVRFVAKAKILFQISSFQHITTQGDIFHRSAKLETKRFCDNQTRITETSRVDNSCETVNRKGQKNSSMLVLKSSIQNRLHIRDSILTLERIHQQQSHSNIDQFTLTEFNEIEYRVLYTRGLETKISLSTVK